MSFATLRRLLRRPTIYRGLQAAVILGFGLGIGSSSFGQAIIGDTPASAEAHSNDDVVKLPAFVLEDTRVANDMPAATYAAPVSDLRFEPRVDVQTRNFAEAQGDVTIRGGIFEGTAVQVAGMTIFDPQTGHYATELPISPEMLRTPEILTGLDHAFSGMNATAGTVRYDWRDIHDESSVQAGWGSGSLYRASLRSARVLRSGDGPRSPRVAAEAEVDYSSANGTRMNGDHRFFRASGRVQADSAAGRTTLFAGYQSKFFGWPNLYTPFGVAETEDLHTTLVMVTHTHESAELSWETGALFRRNRDDYEFDRFRPGIFNPYLHETQVGGAYARIEAPIGDWRIETRAEAAADQIHSTSLGAHHRATWKLGAIASRRWGAGGAEDAAAPWSTRVGFTYDDTNKDPSAVSPLLELAWAPPRAMAGVHPRWYAQYSETSRVPGYTALYSAPGAGLFRGDPALGREESRNLETGFQLRGGSWSVHAAVFRRRDDPLVDWTFTAAAPNARTAREVRIDNTGFEIVGSRTWGAFDVVAGYTWLEKNADYGDAPVDASFYALNFPKHRFTLAVIARLGRGFELRSDNEYRVQEPNLLRTVGGDSAVLSSLGLYWRAPDPAGLEVSLVVDNLWKSDFQELPAVPAPGRQVTLGAGWRW